MGAYTISEMPLLIGVPLGAALLGLIALAFLKVLSIRADLQIADVTLEEAADEREAAAFRSALAYIGSASAGTPFEGLARRSSSRPYNSNRPEPDGPDPEVVERYRRNLVASAGQGSWYPPDRPFFLPRRSAG